MRRCAFCGCILADDEVEVCDQDRGGYTVSGREQYALRRQLSRADLQAYLEKRGFSVYDWEDTETLREAVRLDLEK